MEARKINKETKVKKATKAVKGTKEKKVVAVKDSKKLSRYCRSGRVLW